MKHGLRFAVAALALALLPRPATADAPVASWQFDAGSGTVAPDASGQGADGTLQGDAGWTDGLVGAHALGLSGTGSGFVDIPEPVVDTRRSFTVMACVNVRQVNGYQTFVSIDGAQISGFFLQLRGDTGEFALAVPPADSAGGGIALASSSIAPEPDRWYHLAGVYDAAAQTVSLYVNGVLQQTTPCKTAWRAPGHTLIGRGRFGGPVDFVGGRIDDVRFYQAVLRAADVLAVAQADLPTAALPTTAPPRPATLRIDADQVKCRVSPTLYGLMTEEINHSYDGGLYGELIQNRAFRDDPAAPAHWSLVQGGGGAGAIALDDSQPLSAALPTSLRLSVGAAAGPQRVGAANDGYWGVPVRPDTTYRASLYARAAPGSAGPLSLDIESADGAAVYARATVPKITGRWRRYTATLRTGRAAPTAAARFVVSSGRPGTVWLNLVSLFPPTFHGRANGSRPDLMAKLAGLRPSFLRLPGGNYLEGDTIATRFDWKKTVGPLASRPGHQGPWGYRSDDGLGLLEFLEWCEDLHMQPLLAVYAGYSLRGEHVTPGPALRPYVQDALDEVEYAAGGPGTRWGARRIADGHPAPFKIAYVEVGNEDWFDRSGSYDGRFAQFHDALKARYPALPLIATAGVTSRAPDVIDEHFYLSARQFERDAHRYDTYSRTGPKIFVGEWASQEGNPTPDMNAALGDAAWMTGMERNSDVVIMESYAPLLVNVNPGGSQWNTNLIGYDALSSYGSPSYYAQVMFGANVGDVVPPTTLDGSPTLLQSVTRDSKTGMLYVKIVNAASAPQPVRFDLRGVSRIAPTATVVVLTSADPHDTNTLADPRKVIPVTSQVPGIRRSFSYTFAPKSVTVLKIGTK